MGFRRFVNFQHSLDEKLCWGWIFISIFDFKYRLWTCLPVAFTVSYSGQRGMIYSPSSWLQPIFSGRLDVDVRQARSYGLSYIFYVDVCQINAHNLSVYYCTRHIQWCSGQENLQREKIWTAKWALIIGNSEHSFPVRPAPNILWGFV